MTYREIYINMCLSYGKSLSSYLPFCSLFIMIVVIKYVAKLIKECRYSLVGKYNCCGIRSIISYLFSFCESVQDYKNPYGYRKSQICLNLKVKSI